jgi:signal transduction histidine kinase
MSRAKALLDRLRANADFVFAAVLVATGQAEAWSGQLDADSAAVAVVMLGVTLPLFFVRLSPSLAGLAVLVAMAVAAFVVQPATEDSITAICAILAAFWRVGSDRPPVRAVVAGLAAYALFLLLIWQDPDPFGFGDLVFSSLFSVGPWLAGFALSGRAEREADLELRASMLEDEREAEARAAVAAERARIARELHDVIAHSVSVMTVQAGAARLLLAQDPEQARGPILAVEETGREALAETRRLLGILRSDMSEVELEPQPGMASLETLVTRTRLAGLPVELTVEGDAVKLAPGLDLAAYRVIQEALTNALKYAGPASAWVTVRYLRDALELEISNDGRSPERQNGSGGHGLAGMRERVSLYGGSVEAGPHPVRGFVVRARLPLEGTA